jgi:hypothetical protein
VGAQTKDDLFWQTVDWAYDIRHLVRALPDLHTVDVLQGVRVGTMSARGMVDRRSDNAYKGLVSVVNYRLIRVLFRVPLSDYQNVTVYPRALIQSVALETESALSTFKEVHVPFVKRERGTGKGTRPGAIAAAIRDILFWWTRWVVLNRRPDRGRGRVVS